MCKREALLVCTYVHNTMFYVHCYLSKAAKGMVALQFNLKKDKMIVY